MAYQVLAQKYRPQAFFDILGQEAVARTIKNSISSGRVANAYMFSGPRGVGKTSMARLVAKMLNCEKPVEDGPCNKCTSCVEINRGNSMDVLEIDGASNRGIDEIRELRESVRFLPSKGKYKVYVIDEVHMLTTEAFNALLKTLEEPPPHVKFIFATTESHKVLPTIMSRCQKFDFKRIPAKTIYEQIKAIAKKEHIAIDDKAALLMASSADGSLRDALVILDQMVSFSDKKITVEDILELLGMVHKDSIFRLADAVVDREASKIIGTVDDLIGSGKDPAFIANTLIEYFRHLMVIKTAGEPTLDMALSSEEIALFKAQSQKVSLEEILYILQNISHSLTIMKSVTFTRAPLEIALVRLTKRGSMSEIKNIIDKLEGFASMGAIAAGDASLRTAGDGPGVSKAKNALAPEKRVFQKSWAPAGSAPEEEESAGSGLTASGTGNWKKVLDYVKGKKMSVFTFLNDGKLLDFGEDKIVIGFDQSRSFNKEVVESEKNMELLKEALSSVVGRCPRVEVKMLEFLAGQTKNNEVSDVQKTEEKVSFKPILDKAIDIFGGNIVRDFSDGAE